MNANSCNKQRGAQKLARIPVKIIPRSDARMQRKPDWLRVRLPTGGSVQRLKKLLRTHKLVTVCEEAGCPNLSECFSQGTATFMIMGAACTRRCAFCDVAHGRPDALDPDEPSRIAESVRLMQLTYVVITSVDRDDLPDGGAKHFVRCVEAVQALDPKINVEILVPDFRGRMQKALDILTQCPVAVFNHNIETVPRLYKQARPGSDYQHSLTLLKRYKDCLGNCRTKSGIMLGLGETDDEITQVLKDLRAHGVDGLTLGQYLPPSRYHMPVARYVTPDAFKKWYRLAKQLGFSHVASGPLVRSSYHASEQFS